ncbi:MAG: LysE family transporter [Chloroflexi bacterium]|nr:LysE family transporter [Chloroflexota bacterium]
MLKLAPLFWIFSTSLLVGFSGALTPGPLLVVDITEAARTGFWAGPWVATGHALMELLAVLLLVVGLNRAVQQGAVAGTIGVLGGLVLVWMGISTVVEAPSLSLRAALEGGAGSSGLGPLLGGALASIANPYWLIWWATVGAGYTVRALHHGIAGVGAFYVGHVLSDYSWYTFVAIVVATGRTLLPDLAYQGILVACGLFLLGLGAYFVVSGVGFWRGRPTSATASERR